MRTVLIRLKPNSWEHRRQDFFGLWTADWRTTSMFTSGSARSPFVNIMNSSLVFKLLYSPPYCFSVWCGFNWEMMLILSLGFHNWFGLKVKFHHFSLLLNCKRHLNRISLRFCEIKFFTYTLKSEKEKTILISCCNITVKWFCGTFFGTHCITPWINVHDQYMSRNTTISV